MANVLIDARAMLPPEPLERAVAALDLLKCDDELTLILNQQPHPLLRILANSGFKWAEAEEESGGWRYRIYKECSAAA
jgi:uncharacterized protein (DUF2249 family)